MRRVAAGVGVVVAEVAGPPHDHVLIDERLAADEGGHVGLHAGTGREERVVETWPATEERPPRCPDCGAFLRPDVVWFGEALPAAALHAASEAARRADVFLTVGTSGLVQPAASLPLLAAGNGAVTVEINVEDTPLSPWMGYTLRGPSGVILPALVASTWPG